MRHLASSRTLNAPIVTKLVLVLAFLTPLLLGGFARAPVWMADEIDGAGNVVAIAAGPGDAAEDGYVEMADEGLTSAEEVAFFAEAGFDLGADAASELGADVATDLGVELGAAQAGLTLGGAGTPTHARDTFRQYTDLTDVFWRVHVLHEKVPVGELHAVNDRVITNRDILFLQPWKSLTMLDYHENFLCKPLQKFTGGRFVPRYGHTDFLGAFTDGHTLTEYGTVVVNTHGTSSETREDGTFRTWFTVALNDGIGDFFTAGRLSSEYCPAEEVISFASRYGYELTTFEGENYGTGLEIPGLLRRNGRGDLYISTDLIMRQYANATFDNTVFYFGVCFALRDDTFCQFLIDHGAQCVIGNYMGYSEYVDMIYCDELGKSLVSGAESASDTGVALFRRTHTVQEALDSSWYKIGADSEIGAIPQVKQRTSDFVYWGWGEAQGRVIDERGSGVGGARVEFWRVLDKGFEPYGYVMTADDGSFKFDHVGWGSFVAYVTAPDGRAVAASANFGDNWADLGTITLGEQRPEQQEQTQQPEEEPSAAPDPAANAETPANPEPAADPEVPANPEPADQAVPDAPQPAPDAGLSDEEALERAYQGLVAERGVVSVGPITYPDSEADGAGCIQRLRSDLNGLGGHVVADVDGDGRLEMIVVGFEPSGVDDEYLGTADGTLMYVEAYELAEDLGAWCSARIDLASKTFATVYHDTRVGVFLSPGTAVGLAGYAVNVYVSNSMNDNVEAIRQYAYDGACFTLMEAQLYWTGWEWYQRFAGDAESSGIDSVAQLVLTAAGDGYGWHMTELGQVDESYTDEAYATFAAADVASFAAYAETWRERGVPRGGARFNTDLYDFDAAAKHRVHDAFDGAESLLWACDLRCATDYSTGESAKQLSLG